jgi:antitoxin MazE
MATTIKVRKIGNSKGILFTKALLEKSGIKETVKVEIRDKTILLTATEEPARKRWSDFKKVKQKVEQVNTKFDEAEWTW